MGKAHSHFTEAMEYLKTCGDNNAHPESLNIMQEARKALLEIGSQADWENISS